MRIEVKVYPRSSREEIKQDDDQWKVYVRTSATDGKANAAVCALLAKKFHTAKSNVCIVRGAKSRIKLIEIQTAMS